MIVSFINSVIKKYQQGVSFVRCSIRCFNDRKKESLRLVFTVSGAGFGRENNAISCMAQYGMVQCESRKIDAKSYVVVVGE
jgi:hypothetical protein